MAPARCGTNDSVRSSKAAGDRGRVVAVAVIQFLAVAVEVDDQSFLPFRPA